MPAERAKPGASYEAATRGPHRIAGPSGREHPTERVLAWDAVRQPQEPAQEGSLAWPNKAISEQSSPPHKFV